jgi:hypothetical protein
MSKERVTLRLSEDLRQRIATIKDREGFDHEAEATREVLRRGIESHHDSDSAGEQLGQQATAVAGVGTTVAAIAVGLGQSWAVPFVVPFAAATFLFTVVWASIRTLEGGDLW